ncbi:MAG: hypothetical protein M1294_04370 [Firmicutes bacterium]|uniref:Uncharacterized protein n=2 Tax=Sulfobacillus benefaciens TaxID=453960 RepID=A0A2T2WVK6_9FIRM|nr:hypothetical protein [Bacillota bacterium]MCL5015520.1 hypothetical protein [Bacillota bacterium]PSR26274.1 MAG: hypothetical protein C7B43_14315 [Sulfobacillus benefaciens]
MGIPYGSHRETRAWQAGKAVMDANGITTGFATTAGRAHVSERMIMKQTGHKSTAMVRKYIQDGALFEDNAAAEIGL